MSKNVSRTFETSIFSKLLLESSLSPIVVMKPLHNEDSGIDDFEILLINAAANAYLGGVAVGDTYKNLCSNGIQLELMRKYADAYTLQQTTSFESFIPFKSGMNLDRWIRQNICPYEEGLIISFEALSPDKETDQLLRRAHETENKYKSLFNSLSQGFCIVEVLFSPEGHAYDFRFLETNPAFLKQSGLGEVTNRTMLEINAGTEKYWFEIYGKVLSTKKPMSFEQEAAMTGAWYEVYAYPLGNGNENRVAVLFTDITERKKIEIRTSEERKAALDTLKFKQWFLSNISHEIRTPLTAVIGFADKLMNSTLSDEQRKYVEAIKVSGDEMVNVADNILDLAMGDSDNLKLDERPFRMDACVNNILLLFEANIKKKEITITNNYDTGIPSLLRGYPSRVNQVMLNLIGNAVKFTERGGIDINVSMLKEDSDSLDIAVSISDTGIGIDADRLQHISKALRLDDKNLLFSDPMGMGLSIVALLVHHNGGQIEIKSEQGKGTCVTVVFPLKRYVPTYESNSTYLLKGATGNRMQKVLVVDDIKLNQMLLNVLLSDMGLKPQEAMNGKEAIELLQKNKYDLILMDIQMPVMDGFETTRYIREELLLQVPIIAITADVTPENLSRIEVAGMNGYMTKPVRKDILLSKIRETIQV